jgi:ubiquinone/menaquinone biosynthesis C-methylase UbiE
MKRQVESPESAARRIFGERAARYTTSKTHTDPAVLARVAELACADPNSRALDIGTGTGHTAFAVAAAGASVVGLDLTPQMLEEARQLRQKKGVCSVALILGDAHALPFPNGTFQAVTCRRTAHHFSDITEALREMHRVLHPRGKLVIDDRSVPEDDFVDKLMNELDTYHDASHIRQYRSSEWQSMLQASGFGIETLQTYTQLRSISSHTKGVEAAAVQKILEMISDLDEVQRKKLNLVRKQGQTYYSHWYITVSAGKEGSS